MTTELLDQVLANLKQVRERHTNDLDLLEEKQKEFNRVNAVLLQALREREKKIKELEEYAKNVAKDIYKKVEFFLDKPEPIIIEKIVEIIPEPEKPLAVTVHLNLPEIPLKLELPEREEFYGHWNVLKYLRQRWQSRSSA